MITAEWVERTRSAVGEDVFGRIVELSQTTGWSLEAWVQAWRAAEGDERIFAFAVQNAHLDHPAAIVETLRLVWRRPQ